RLQVQRQQVEDNRANALGTWVGAGGGRSLMLNGHMDTSYSGREPWLRAVPGFQPQAFERDGRLYGLGISNMKGALACYVETVRVLRDAGIRLRGDVVIAARRRSSTSARSRAASAGASRARPTTPTSSSTSGCRRRRRWPSPVVRSWTGSVPSPTASRTTGWRKRCT